MRAPKTPPQIEFTENCYKKVHELIQDEGNPSLKLRVFITGGGCAGFKYGFTFDEVTHEEDILISVKEVTFVIDPMSYQYLVGATIDYQKNLEGEEFIIHNPNAVTTCGCGSSFST